MKSFPTACLLACASAVLPAAAQDVANGQALYERICRGCHGFPPLGGPERAAGNPALIQQAISGRVPAMSLLRGIVSVADTVDIAAWLATLSAPPPTPAVPAFDFTDLWWNPAESGWGLNLIQHPSGIVFGVMYTYEPPDRATWFVLPDGRWETPLRYTGTFYRAAGPPMDRPGFDPAAVRVSPVGTATLQFADRDDGTFVFGVDGTVVTKAISRQPF